MGDHPPLDGIEQRQKIAFREVANGSSYAQAFRKAGYSEAVATQPTKITKQKSWQELVARYLPDNKLLRKTDEGLNATTKDEDGDVIPDFAIRHKYLDTAFKLKGSYAPDKSVVLSVDVDPGELERFNSLTESIENSM